jgi:hypothetical protein
MDAGIVTNITWATGSKSGPPTLAPNDLLCRRPGRVGPAQPEVLLHVMTMELHSDR